MNRINQNSDKNEEHTCYLGKCDAREDRSPTGRSNFNMPAVKQSPRQPESYSQEANTVKVPSRSPDIEQALPITKESRELDEIQKADKKEFLGSSYVSKVDCKPKLPPKRQLEELLMSKAVFREIRQTIGSIPAETGGLLMGSIEDFRVTNFIFDDVSFKKQRYAAVWYPHTESLNERIEIAESKGQMFIGVVHSHPRGFMHPSGPDASAAWSNMTSESNPHLNAYLLPIVQSAADGPFQFHSFVATCHPEGKGRVILRKIKLLLVD